MNLTHTHTQRGRERNQRHCVSVLCWPYQYINTQGLDLIVWNIPNWNMFQQKVFTATQLTFQTLAESVPFATFMMFSPQPQLGSLGLQNSLKLQSFILWHNLWLCLSAVTFSQIVLSNKVFGGKLQCFVLFVCCHFICVVSSFPLEDLAQGTVIILNMWTLGKIILATMKIPK